MHAPPTSSVRPRNDHSIFGNQQFGARCLVGSFRRSTPIDRIRRGSVEQVKLALVNALNQTWSHLANEINPFRISADPVQVREWGHRQWHLA